MSRPVDVGHPADRSATGDAPAGARPEAPAHELLAPLLFQEIARVRAAVPRVVASASEAQREDGDAVHDLRVGIRRLRTIVRAAHAVFGKRRLRAPEAVLRDHARASGRLRDDEVLAGTIASLSLGAPARAAVDAWLAGRSDDHKKLRADLAKLVGDGRGHDHILRALVEIELLATAPPKRATVSAFALAEGAFAAVAQAVVDASDVGPDDVEALHDLRICFKRLRYTGELFAPQLGDRGKVATDLATSLQKKLGDVHDLDQARAAIRAAGRAFTPTERRDLSIAIAVARHKVAVKAVTDLGKALAAIS